jgi:hypothetical protein
MDDEELLSASEDEGAMDSQPAVKSDPYALPDSSNSGNNESNLHESMNDYPNDSDDTTRNGHGGGVNGGGVVESSPPESSFSSADMSGNPNTSSNLSPLINDMGLIFLKCMFR